MIRDRKVLAVIPARGGSKGIPGKNLRSVGGKPLIAWTLDAARGSEILDRVIVSTDDVSIREVAEGLGAEVPYMRDPSLGTDSAPTMGVILEALERCAGYDIVVTLQPTSPLRAAEDIDGAVRSMVEHDAQSCASVCLAEESPHWMFSIAPDHRIRPLLKEPVLQQRQALPDVYVLNGAVYVNDAAWFREQKRFIDEGTVGWIMPRERSFDLDTEEDLRILEMIIGDLTR